MRRGMGHLAIFAGAVGAASAAASSPKAARKGSSVFESLVREASRKNLGEIVEKDNGDPDNTKIHTYNIKHDFSELEKKLLGMDRKLSLGGTEVFTHGQIETGVIPVTPDNEEFAKEVLRRVYGGPTSALVEIRPKDEPA